MANETLRIDLTARDSTAAAFNSLQNSLANVNRSMGTVTSAFSAFKGAIFSGAALAGVVKYSDEWTNLSNKLRAAGLSASETSAAQNELLKISQRSRSDLTSVADLYSRLTLASQSFGASQKEVGQVTETISKVFKMSGKTAQEAQSAALQLGQALASGVLQGDELRSLRESAPELVRAIAREFNITVGELKDAGAKGELEASRVFKAILKIAPQVNEQFANSKSTFADYATAVSNAFYSVIQAYQNATKESDAYIEAAERVRAKQAELAQSTGLLAAQQADLDAKAKAIREKSLLGNLGTTQGDITNLETSLRSLTADLERFGAINVKKGDLERGLAEINRAINGTADDAISARVELDRLGQADPSFRAAFEKFIVLLDYLAKTRIAAKITGDELKALGGVTIEVIKPPKFMSGADRAADASFVATQEQIAKRLLDDQIINSKLSEAEQKIVAKRDEIRKRLGDAAAFIPESLLTETARRILLNEASGETAKAAQKEAEALNALAEKYKLIADPMLKYNQQMDEALKLYQAGKLSADEYANAIKNIEQQKANAASKTDPMKDNIKELERAIEGFGKKSADAFAEFVMSGKMNFKDLIQSIIKELISLMAYQSIFKPLFGSISGSLTGGGGLGGLFSGLLGGVGSSMYPAGSVIGPNLPTRATGGNITANRAYIVGEKGPELFMANRNGSIVPNDAMGGGASVVVNVINQAGVEVETTETERPDGMKEITMMIRREVTSGIANGTFDKPLRSAFGLARQGY